MSHVTNTPTGFNLAAHERGEDTHLTPGDRVRLVLLCETGGVHLHAAIHLLLQHNGDVVKALATLEMLRPAAARQLMLHCAGDTSMAIKLVVSLKR